MASRGFAAHALVPGAAPPLPSAVAGMPGARNGGFTLIEVMIVVAVIAILAAIALPNYSEYVMRGRIPDGIVPLADMQARLEQYFQDHRTYKNACEAGTIAPAPADTRYFTFACTDLTDDGYVVTATGLSTGSMSAFTYRLELASGSGVKRSTISLPAGWATPSPNACWALKRDGTC